MSLASRGDIGFPIQQLAQASTFKACHQSPPDYVKHNIIKNTVTAFQDLKRIQYHQYPREYVHCFLRYLQFLH